MATAPSVIRLRMQGMDSAKVAELVSALVREFEAVLAKGCLLTVKQKETELATSSRSQALNK